MAVLVLDSKKVRDVVYQGMYSGNLYTSKDVRQFAEPPQNEPTRSASFLAVQPTRRAQFAAAADAALWLVFLSSVWRWGLPYTPLLWGAAMLLAASEAMHPRR